MRITNIGQYLGGADNVRAFSMLSGEQREWTGTIRDTNGNPLDITNYTVSVASTEIYRASLEISGSSNPTVAITSLVRDPDDSAAIDSDPTLEKGVESDGEIILTIPAGLLVADFNIPLNATEQVPILAIFLSYTDASGNTRKSRVLGIIRYGG